LEKGDGEKQSNGDSKKKAVLRGEPWMAKRDLRHGDEQGEGKSSAGMG